MKDIVDDVKHRLQNASKEKGLKTPEVRALSAVLFRGLEDKNSAQVFAQCEALLAEREWALGVIAYDWAYRVRRQYTPDTFFIFEAWLKEYVSDWGDCDDFCTHAFGELISQNPDLFSHVLGWTTHQNFAVRRAAAVGLIVPIKQERYQQMDPFVISDALMQDPHYLVLNGYGWMLKVYASKDPGGVYEYLRKHQAVMPRLALRYALEKFAEPARRDLLRSPKP